MTKETILYLIDGAKTDFEVKERLNDAEVVYADLSKDSGYLNLRIPTKDAQIRIYRSSDRRIQVQKFEMVQMKYSGVPTFEPSGRRSF